MQTAPIETYGISPKPCFGGVIEVIDGVSVEVVSDCRVYIAIGMPGFNSPANNRSGYISRKATVAACRRYNNK